MPRKRTPHLLMLTVFLLPLLTSHHVEAAEPTIKPIVLTGDLAPEGEPFVQLGSFAVNNLGAIAFSARDPLVNQFSLYLAAEGRITRLVKPGDPIRVTCNDTSDLLGVSASWFIFMNDSGDIVFPEARPTLGHGLPALFSGGTLTRLGVCPNIYNPQGEFVTILDAVVTAMNNTDTIALALFTLPRLFERFLIQGGAPTLLPLRGTPAPGGGTIDSATIRAISDSGDPLVWFSTGQTSHPEPPKPNGLFIESGTQRIPVALSGEPAREGTTFRTFSEHGTDMNNLGQVVFVAELSDFTWGIFRRNPDGTLTSLVHRDDAAPEAGGETFGSVLGSLGLGGYLAIDVDINDKGDVVFVGPRGIFLLTAEGALSKVVRRGDAAPGGGTFQFVFGRLNNRREIVLGAALSTGQGGIFLASAAGLEIELADPVPDLLSELTLTAEAGKARLATAGRVVDGVAADGVARVVVRVKAPDPGTVELTLVDTAGMPLASAEESGSLAPIGGGTGFNSVFVPTVQVPDKGPMAFAIYHAPSRFVRAASGDANMRDRQVTLHARFTPQTGGAAKEETILIKIARPPVVLVHGIWGSEDTWNLFGPLNADPRFFVQRVNYRDTSAAGFGVNVAIVGEQIKLLIDLHRTQEKVAAVQADVVTHSMGGLLARMQPLRERAYFRRDNFLQGDVHKVINIGTPHSGSELAAILRTKVSNPRCRAAFTAAGVPIHRGAIHDLSPGSIALRELNRLVSALRLHNIVGIASARQKRVNASGGEIGAVQAPLICGRILPPGGFDAVFRDDNDLIVAATSQRARLSPTSPAVSTFAPLIHTRADGIFDAADGAAELESVVVSQEVIELLNLPVADAKFLRLPPQ